MISRISRFFSAVALCGLALVVLAPRAQSGTASTGGGKEITPAAVVKEPFVLSGEFDAALTYVGDARVRREGRGSSFDEIDSSVHLVLTPRVALGYLRLGVDWDRYSFGLSRNSPLPNTLQSFSLVVGLDTKFSDSILVRIEAQPGFYGSSLEHSSGRDFKVPFLIGGTYIFGPDFQVMAGVSVDFDRKYPVLPGVGFRWKMAPHLVLNAMLPTPRLEYELSRSTTVFVGAEVKSDTFRVDNYFGTEHRDKRLNRATLTYSEIRVGAGWVQKLTPTITLTGEAGVQPYREFDFDRADVRYRTDGTGFYGKIALHASF